MLVYRIGSSRYPANDGKGAARFGGRWNQKGVPLIYAAESRALCALEILAGSREFADDYISIPIEIPDNLPRRSLTVADLPKGWDSAEHGESTRVIGTAWAARMETAVLVVPSSVLHQERNYLINPCHPDFSRIVFHRGEPFLFDRRLTSRGRE
ncbi:MAG: RES domain-containing protein [Bryobacterales bacterium]|nr:RES domain-containing protein [Bryobacterales bacterium]